MTPTPYLPRLAAAERIGISLSTIDRYVKAKRLPKLKIGARTLFRVEDVDALVQRVEVNDG